jgi:hypothetical protein
MYGSEISFLTRKVRGSIPLPHGMIRGVKRSPLFKADQKQRGFFRGPEGISGLGEGRCSSNGEKRYEDFKGGHEK